VAAARSGPQARPRPATPSRRSEILGLGLGSALVSVGALTLARCPSPGAKPHPQPSASAASRTPSRPGHFADRLDVSTFQRGNLHAHTTVSDGDAPIELAVKTYSRLGYQFAAITDHNHYFDPVRFRWAERSDFVLIAGEEISMGGKGELVHVSALCTQRGIGGHEFEDVVSGLQWALDQIRAQDGVAIINHPNWRWTLEPQHIAAAHGATLIEIFSGHLGARWQGDDEHSSAEDKWQILLLGGSTLAPSAGDDAHTYLNSPSLKVEEPAGYPGEAWVAVFGAETSRDKICQGLAAGQLYGSSGPKLQRLSVQNDTFTVWPEDPAVLVEFITSSDDTALVTFPERDPDSAEGSWRASYRLQGPERFVRARITQADGLQAWTAAYRVVP
jgi:hypothetical protein